MPGFELGHLIIIFFVAFIVLGPNRMVETARALGKFYQQTRVEWIKFSQSFQAGLDGITTETPAESSTPAITTDTATPSADVAASAENTETAAVASDTSPSTLTPSIETASSPASPIVPKTIAKKRKQKKTKPPAQSISDHLIDLRTALIRSILAIVLLTIIAAIFSPQLLSYFVQLSGKEKLSALSPMDGFLIHLRIALYGGLFLSAPVWIFELMRFIAPALLPHEKRLIVPGIVAAMILFLFGNIFGYLMLGPMMAVILGGFGNNLEYLAQAEPFISFVVFFLVASGISFELPIVLLTCIRIGLLSRETLRRQRKIVYFIIFVFAELITPVPDPIIGPAIVMSPMIILFELALIVARWVVPSPSTVTIPPATS